LPREIPLKFLVHVVPVGTILAAIYRAADKRNTAAAAVAAASWHTALTAPLLLLLGMLLHDTLHML